MIIHRTNPGYAPIARITIGCVKLPVVGTRVLCFCKILEKGAQRDLTIAFVIWNPSSLENCGENVKIARKLH